MKTALILLLVTGPLCHSQIQKQDKVFTVFVMNFAKYTQWPENVTNGDFVFGILGSSTIGDELKLLAATKTIGNQKIQVRQFQTPAEVTGCHLIYVADDKSGAVGELINRLTDQPTLIVTEKEGLSKKGGGISFLVADGKVRFEVNKSAIEKKGMKISSSLLTLGTIVDN